MTRVFVLRAWREQDHVRVRLLHDQGGRVNEVVCDSVDDALALVRRLLLDLETETRR